MSETEQRAEFEAWVTAPPYEQSVQRYPDDDTQTAWPGQYRREAVQLAWEAWQASRLAALREALTIATTHEAKCDAEAAQMATDVSELPVAAPRDGA